MRELVDRFMGNNLSRREFVQAMAAMGISAAGIASADNLDLGDHRTIDGPGPLDAFVIDDAADDDHLVDAPTLSADKHALKDLDAFFHPFDNSCR